MRGFLAVSVSPHGPAAARVPHRDAIALLAGPHESGPVVATRDGWLAFTAAEPGDRLGDDPGTGFTVRLTRSIRDRAGDIDADRIAKLLGEGTDPDGEALTAILPPFAAAHLAHREAPVLLAGDWLGLRQLFRWQGEGVAAVSTSALALAAVAGAGLHTGALGVQSLMGWQVGLETVFTGVEKLGPAAVAKLRDGTVTVERYASDDLALDGAPGLDAAVEEMAGILRAFHHAYLTDHPETVLQLSGGQDSRLLLGAVPPELRRGMAAFTLDTHGGAEARVATRLATRCGLAHTVHWTDERPPVDAEAGHRAARAAAAALDCMASPMALAPLALIEADLEQGHRLSGAGGELARGFYYPGQPRHAGTDERMVRRLAEWRLFTNEAAEADALEPDFVAAARSYALDAVTERFAGYDRDWLRATDDFYLWDRMARWAGAQGTPAAVDRFYVNPLLDRRFVQLALAVAPDEKRDSRLTGRLMQRLDAGLAAIPLDSGLVPARLGRPGLSTSAAVARVTVRKTVGKVRQRLSGARRTQLGAGDVAARVVAHWRASPETADPLRRAGMVRAAWLDELLDGRREALPATVAFLMNTLVATEATEPGRATRAGTAGGAALPHLG
ncbi:hypothetical protein [Phytohabitans houttuyneae]|uniref:Asparagine synthetase domain-containing protein n=1 Tax=Phytohabitans houttuyneae TaxID=1076126 RepID=A0A6V8K8M2_9ACTN|nr:hypothetical protein [Phytohabitans houttuyneae]GFJ78366.1 hypothetical protein Phou_025460 [Phytohabitans houttuyneae]